MARKPLTTPRKEASQQRSRATVDALVEATARILVKDGFDKASTNRIAEAAGVSVGSLYQYFPSKEALVLAVIERHNKDSMRLVRTALSEIGSLPLAQAIRAIVSVAIKAHRINPKLHRVLTEQIPRTGPLQNVEAFNRENFSLFRSYLESRRDLRPMDLALATFVCVSSIEALAHNAVLHGEGRLTEEAGEVLIEEASRLIVAYLQ